MTEFHSLPYRWDKWQLLQELALTRTETAIIFKDELFIVDIVRPSFPTLAVIKASGKSDGFFQLRGRPLTDDYPRIKIPCIWIQWLTWATKKKRSNLILSANRECQKQFDKMYTYLFNNYAYLVACVTVVAIHCLPRNPSLSINYVPILPTNKKMNVQFKIKVEHICCKAFSLWMLLWVRIALINWTLFAKHPCRPLTEMNQCC